MRGEDKLLFEPEAFLELFEVREEGDDVGGESMNGSCRFKRLDLPPPTFTSVGYFEEGVELHDFVFEVEVEFAGEESAEVFVDKEVGGVAAGIGAQVLFERCHVADAVFQRRQRVKI